MFQVFVRIVKQSHAFDVFYLFMGLICFNL
jgi:hypothetical protein